MWIYWNISQIFLMYLNIKKNADGLIFEALEGLNFTIFQGLCPKGGLQCPPKPQLLGAVSGYWQTGPSGPIDRFAVPLVKGRQDT